MSHLLHEFRKQVAWRIRDWLGQSPRTPSETVQRLRWREQRGDRAPRRFPFAWGNFDYVAAGQLASQFEEIFIHRQYGFQTGSMAPVIVDCGGNVGLSAIWFKLHHPQCQLTVYEPDPALATLVETNLRRAGFNDVTVHAKAAWIETGTVAFAQTGDDKGRVTSDGNVRVAAIDLAAALPLRVDLLKIDIEGGEFAVLRRLCDSGSIDRVRALVCEFHVWRDCTDHFLDILTRLRRHGLRLAFNASANGWIGLTAETSPFEAIGRNHVLVEVYAWRGPDNMDQIQH